MRQRELKKLKAMVVKLTCSQRRELRGELASEDDADASVGIIEAEVKRHHCPHCGSERMVRNGSASGLQRYKCRSCHRTFNAMTGTPLARLRQKAKWLAQADALCEGMTITQAAKRLKLARSTAFRWRHRFMAVPKTIQAQSLAGVAEADETFFLHSRKGQRHLDRKPRRRGGRAAKRGLSKEQIPVLVARDRSGATANIILAVSGKADLVAALKPLLPADIILCTDGSSVLAAAVKEIGDSSPGQCFRRAPGHRWRLSRPERQCLRQPAQELDPQIPRRCDQVSGFVPQLVSNPRPVDNHRLATRFVAGVGNRPPNRHQLTRIEPSFYGRHAA